MSCRPYASYRETHVEGLDLLPDHWFVGRLGYQAWVRARLGWKGLKADEYVDEGFALLATPNIKGDSIDFKNVNYVSRARYEESPEIMLKADDVLLTKDGSTLGTVNVVRKLPCAATVNSSIAVITTVDRLNSIYLYYVFRTDYIVSLIESVKDGMGVPHLFQDDIKRFRLPVPPLAEQVAIAGFLDRETAKIDALVEEQRRLIALLKEKRQAVISHAVTKGLDPDAPMTDSGVEWLDEVPSHWEVTRLKYHLDLLTSGSRGWGDFYSESGPLFVRIGNLTRDTIDLNLEDIQRVAVSSEMEGARARLRPGDIIFSITAYLGSVAVVPPDIEEAYVSQHVALGRLRQNAPQPRWIAYIVLARLGKTHFELCAYGGTKIQLSLDDVAEMPLVVPPSEEQIEILDRLESRLKLIRDLESEATAGITLLQERRSALISAAVTGKIDVRSTVQVLPLPVDRARARGWIAAEIIERSAHHPTFGRVKLQKIAYLAEAHVGVVELEGAYLREAAGPLDREMIREMEREACALVGVRVEQPDGSGSAVTYRLGDRRGTHYQDLATLLGNRAAKFDKLVADIGTIDTKGAEAVATLYAVWNDALIDGETPADMEITLAVLSEWHPQKAKKFRINELQIWLDWMRRHGLVPTGSGPKTKTGRLFA